MMSVHAWETFQITQKLQAVTPLTFFKRKRPSVELATIPSRQPYINVPKNKR